MARAQGSGSQLHFHDVGVHVLYVLGALKLLLFLRAPDGGGGGG